MISGFTAWSKRLNSHASFENRTVVPQSMNKKKKKGGGDLLSEQAHQRANQPAFPYHRLNYGLHDSEIPDTYQLSYQVQRAKALHLRPLLEQPRELTFQTFIDARSVGGAIVEGGTVPGISRGKELMSDVDAKMRRRAMLTRSKLRL